MPALSFKSYVSSLPAAGKAVELNGSLEPGGFLCVQGSSGIGKTSLAYSICGLRPGSETGTLINASGQNLVNLSAAKRSIGVVFQGAQLFAHLTVQENLLLSFERKEALKMLSRDLKEKRIEQALESVGLKGFDQKKTKLLSGGEQQRAAFVRAVLSEPDFYIVDEGFSALDEKSIHRVSSYLSSDLKNRGVPAVFFSHQDVPEGVFDKLKLLKWSEDQTCLEF